MKIDACHLLLGRPWEYDRRVQHDGYLNTYSFTKDVHKVTLKQLHPEELDKWHKPVQDTLMTRSEVVGHINEREPILIVVCLEEPKEEGHGPLDQGWRNLFASLKMSLLKMFLLSFPLYVIFSIRLISFREHHCLTKPLTEWILLNKQSCKGNWRSY